MHLTSRIFRCFLHDVHHAYLLLHRAMQTLPPMARPDLEPMPHPSEGLPDQHEELQPTETLAAEPEARSPMSETFFQEVMNHTMDDEDEAQPPPHTFHPLPRPVRYVNAPEPHELPKPTPKMAGKKPPRRPKVKKSPTTKKSSSPPHSEAATPWTQEELTTLKDLKTNQRLRPSWKAVAERLKRSEADVKNQWSLMQANQG